MSKKSDLVRGFGLAMSIGATMDEIRLALGVTEEEFHILATPEGRPHLEQMIAGLKLPVETPEPVVTYLLRLYEGEHIILDPTDGKRTIVQATDVFTAYIDPGFASFGLDVPARPTVATECAVHEQIADGTFAQNFDSLGRPRTELCSTPHQVIEFAVKHRDRLREDGYGNFFLIQRTDGVFFVADVCVNTAGRLLVDVRPFSYSGVWRAEDRRRFVVPQLVPSAT